jgi:hypothetical protein
LGVSFTEHQARGLGDCVAVALARDLRLSDMQKPALGGSVVALLELAFKEPSHIAMEQNKQARATLLLLDLVAEHAPDGATRLRAQDLAGRLVKANAEMQKTAAP